MRYINRLSSNTPQTRTLAGNRLVHCLLLTLVTLSGALPLGAQQLNGAGATFPYPIYSRWFSRFADQHPGARINYQAIGSGGGIRQIIAGTVDFGATDTPMNQEQIQKLSSTVLHIPTVLGAVVPVYNLPGLQRPLRLSPDVLADIYLGHITRWNDARIVRDNPQANLPSDEIIVVHRADGSGTTFVFTDYLSKVSPAWRSGPGASPSPRWPPMGIGGKGNEGVAGMVRLMPASIGYVELVFAVQTHMAMAELKNSTGNWVAPTVASVSDAAASLVSQLPADYRTSITNAPGATSWPVASYTWLLIPQQSTDPAKGKVLHDFLLWMLDYGEAQAAGLSYAPLPLAVSNKVRKSIETIR